MTRPPEPTLAERILAEAREYKRQHRQGAPRKPRWTPSAEAAFIAEAKRVFPGSHEPDRRPRP